MSFELLRHIITTQDAATLKQEITLLQNSTYKTKPGAFQETLNTEVRKWVADQMESDLKITGTAEQKYLVELLTELKKHTSVQISISFEPTRKNIEKIHDWLFKEIGEPVLLDFLYDPHVIAGIKLSYNGKYYDFSLGKKLESSIGSIVQKTFNIYA